MDTTPLNLLSLDGGGVRGLSSVIILESIMDRVKHILQLSLDPLPADYFDLIGGTSTGGRSLIAIMLGRLRMSVPEAIKCYEELSREIFEKKQPRIHSVNRYNPERFSKIIKKTVRDKMKSDDAKLYDPEDECCRSFVCCVGASNVPDIRLLRTYHVPGQEDIDCAIWEAARATCAAPKYFPEMVIGSGLTQQRLFDGGLGCNNPIYKLHEEAQQIFASDRQVGCVLSLGNGTRKMNSIEVANWFHKKVFPFGLVKNLKRLATDCEHDAKRMHQRYDDIQDLYFRFSVEHGLDKIRLDEWASLRAVRECTMTFLRHPIQSRRLEKAAAAIAGRSQREDSITLGQISFSLGRVIEASRHSEQSKRDPKTYFSHLLLPPTISWPRPERDQKDNLAKRFQVDEYTSGNWFLQTDEFRGFHSSTESSILWVKGPLGCGKSVLSAVVVAYLSQESSDSNSNHVLYFYCQDNRTQTTSAVLLRALLAQTLSWPDQRIIGTFNSFFGGLKEREDLDHSSDEDLIGLLKNVISLQDRKIFLILDGIDSLRSGSVFARKLIRTIFSSELHPRIGLLLSSHFDIKAFPNSLGLEEMETPPKLFQLDITPTCTWQDIESYVSHRVNEASSELRLKPHAMRDEIVETVCHTAAGMFSYAALVLDELEGDNLSSKSAIKNTMQKLPKGLHNLYSRSLDRPKRSLKGHEVFQWVFCSMRPLSWGEVKSGIAMVGGKFSDDDWIEHPRKLYLQQSCGPLIETFGENDKLRFFHHSVKGFLHHQDGPGHEMGIPRAHSMVVQKLLAILMLDDALNLRSDPAANTANIVEYSTRSGRHLYVYALFNWYQHLKQIDTAEDSDVEKMVERFLWSPFLVQWLVAVMSLSSSPDYEFHSSALTSDVVDCLTQWSQKRRWGNGNVTSHKILTWTRDFSSFMLDWGTILEKAPGHIYHIQHELLSIEGGEFRRTLQSDVFKEPHSSAAKGRRPKASSQQARWIENLELARDAKAAAAASQRDSYAMEYLAVVTMVFLPGTFVTTLFSMPFFDWHSSENICASGFGIYWATAIPLTMVTISIWIVWTYFQSVQIRRHSKRAKRRLYEGTEMSEITILTKRRKTEYTV